MKDTRIGRRYIIRGRVQGVGFRYYAEHAANALGLSGYVRNLDNGDVEVYAVGLKEQLSDLAAMLRKGPRYADVRGVEEQEAAVEKRSGFHIRH